jgi:hypothetical protein
MTRKIKYDDQTQCCVTGSDSIGGVFDLSAKETVQVCFRPSRVLGPEAGDVAWYGGIGHAYTVTNHNSSGLAANDDGPKGSEWTDHSDATPGSDICVDVEIEKCCYEEAIKHGKKFPKYHLCENNCNSAVRQAVEECGGEWGPVWREFLRRNQDHQDLKDMGEAMSSNPFFGAW